MTGVDWPELELSEKIKVKKVVDGVEKEVEEVKKTPRPGYLEAVYHLYSMELKHGPVIIRLRTENRTDKANLPSLTPVWRGAEFQERARFFRPLRNYFRRPSRIRGAFSRGTASGAIFPDAGSGLRRAWRTITNTSLRRTTKCSTKPSNIIRRRRSHERGTAQGNGRRVSRGGVQK